jgi:glutamyl-Q tRNA(Asp) synthetase
MPGAFRFAPSPNGRLHLGHALSALLNRDLARALDARLLLRIEDIDPQRTREDFVDGIFKDLDWLGFVWERPVRRQSAHMAEYGAVLDRLDRDGLVYPCFCSRAEIAAKVAFKPDRPRDPDGAPVYPGTCRELSQGERERRIRAGDPHVRRLDMAAALARIGATPTWREWDGAGGVVDAGLDAAAWGDVVLARRDVPTSYHLSVVWDDAVQGITHVVRGRDLYASTAVHRVLQTLLELPAPLYYHHALLLDAEGAKLAKSRASRSLESLRARGDPPPTHDALMQSAGSAG